MSDVGLSLGLAYARVMHTAPESRQQVGNIIISRIIIPAISVVLTIPHPSPMTSMFHYNGLDNYFLYEKFYASGPLA